MPGLLSARYSLLASSTVMGCCNTLRTAITLIAEIRADGQKVSSCGVYATARSAARLFAASAGGGYYCYWCHRS